MLPAFGVHRFLPQKVFTFCKLSEELIVQIADGFQMIIDRSKKNKFVSAGLISKSKWILEQFAGFYQVSQTSAAIRLTELGLLS